MAGDTDMNAHRATYEGVLNLFKYGVVACALITALVIYLLA